MLTHATAHTGSYYAATASRATDYPALAGHADTDVCVIGAGFTGLSAALELAERGYRVRVLEASKVGWGASGRNGGQVIAGISGEARLARELGPAHAEQLQALRWAGHDIIRGRIERYDIRCDLKPGYADVAIKQRHLRHLQDNFDALQRHRPDCDARLLDAAETRDAIGSGAYIGGLLNMQNLHLHPLNLCLGEADAAVANGAVIHEASPVIRIEHGPRPTVHTRDGSVSADFVIVAGNAYHDVAPELRGLILPVYSFIIATEPLSGTLAESVLPTDIAVCDPNFVIEYFRKSADGRLLFGGRCNYAGDDPVVIERALRPRMCKVFPQLADAAIDFAWGGRMGLPFNRVPQFGRLAANVFYAQGYSGHGVNASHIAGQILADVVAGTSERFDLFARLKTPRIPGAFRFAGPLVRLGILYYQVRDRL
jgi:gamma-glutamylputrescine oxidase